MEVKLGVLLLVFFIVTGVSGQTKTEVKDLYTYLFTTNDYNTMIRPINDQVDQLFIYIDFYLTSIINLDAVEEKLTTTGFIDVVWEDNFLTWNPASYGNMERIYVPQNKIWRPDLSLQNGLTTIKELGSNFILCDVEYTGLVFWRPSGVFETKCSIDIVYFPFDRQTCHIELGNWASPKDIIDVELGKKGINLEFMNTNGEWDLLSTTAEALETTDNALVRFSLTVKRKPLYFIMTIILPVVFLSLLIDFTFVLPMESGEKMSYAVTVYLAFAVFLTIVSGLLPVSSTSSPILSIYLIILLSIGTFIIIITAFQLRLHFREGEVTPRYQKFVSLGRRLRCYKQSGNMSETKVKPIPAGKEAFSDEENIKDNYEEDITWKSVTTEQDFWFFWLFFVVIISVSVIMFTYSYMMS